MQQTDKQSATESKNKNDIKGETMKQQRSTHVRFTEKEYKKIENESRRLELSIPKLLKDAYFKRAPTKVLMGKKEVDIFRKDLNRIGNNLNQVARNINSGLLAGWCDSLDKILDEFRTLNNLIRLGYGVRKS